MRSRRAPGSAQVDAVLYIMCIVRFMVATLRGFRAHTWSAGCSSLCTRKYPFLILNLTIEKSIFEIHSHFWNLEESSIEVQSIAAIEMFF